MADQVDDFENVYHGPTNLQGRLRFTQAGLGWKCSTDPSAKVVLINKAQIKSASWMRVARGFQLRINLEKDRHIFEGLQRTDYDTLRKCLEYNCGIKLETKDTSVRGWNWGKAEVQAHDLSFQVQQRVAFEIPLSSITNSNMAGKNEVALEFSAPPAQSSSSSKPVDELMEMRFYVPGRSIKQRGSDDEDEERSDDEEEGELDEEGNEISAAQSFHDRIKKAARVGDTAGEEIVSFSEVLVVTPRGRYEIEMHVDHLRLRGKTYDYKVTYKSIKRQFSLPKLDEKHWQLIISVDPPLRQGQTKYPFLVMQFPADEEVDVTLNMEEDELRERYDGKLKKEYSDQTYVIMANLFETLVGKEMIPAGKFSSVDGMPGIKCNVKAIQGELYFLEKGMIFIAKSPINIDFGQITKALFSRVTGAMRHCDLTVKLNSDVEHTFTAINKDELPAIKSYLKTRNVRVKELADDVGMRDPTKMDLGDDDDEDMSDVEEDDDGGKTRVRAGGDDDSESEDEDFQADTDDDSSSGDSDNESNGSVVSDDMVEAAAKKAAKTSKANGSAAPKKKAAAAAPTSKAAKSKETIEDSDEDEDVEMNDGDDDEAPPPKKKAKKD